MRTLVALIAALLIALGTAPPAQATVDAYLNDLASSPWGFTGPIETWVTIGYAVCHRIEMGYNQTDLVNFVVRNTGDGVYAAQAAYVVEAAEVHLCGGGSGRYA